MHTEEAFFTFLNFLYKNVKCIKSCKNFKTKINLKSIKIKLLH